MNRSVKNQLRVNQICLLGWYCILKHKGLALSSFVFGIAIAAIYWFASESVYFSTSAILVKYVVQPSELLNSASERTIVAYGKRGEEIMDTELQILKSMDVARETAKVIGPEKIIGNVVPDEIKAALMIKKGLDIRNERNSQTITITFKHTNKNIVKEVLDIYILEYFKAHIKLHLSGVGLQELGELQERSKRDLADIDSKLEKIKSDSSILIAEDSEKAINEQLKEIDNALLEAQRDMATQEARVGALKGVRNLDDSKRDTISSVTAQEYIEIMADLDEADKNYRSLSKLRRDNPQLARNKELRLDLLKKRDRLLKENPSLEQIGDGKDLRWTSVMDENVKLAASKATVDLLTIQMNQLKKRAKVIIDASSEIKRLEESRKLALNSLIQASSSIESASIANRTLPTQIPNLVKTQQPTEALTISNPSRIILLSLLPILLLGSTLIAVASKEFVFDTSIKCRQELSAITNEPIIITISCDFDVEKNGRRQLADDDAGAIRDQLVYDLHSLTYKPKLIGISAIGSNEDVTQYAMALVSSFKEKHSNKVMLFDLTEKKGSTAINAEYMDVRQQELASNETATQAMVTVNYGKKLHLSPGDLYDIIPDLQASDADFVILALPNLSETKPLIGFGAFMDKLLIIIDGEKTKREDIFSAFEKLKKARSNVGIIYHEGRYFK